MKAMKKTKSLVAIAVGMCLAGVVLAQGTAGNVSGVAKAGTVVVISNDSGFTRTVTADSSGRFAVNQLPVGEYKVEAKGLGTRTITVTIGSTTGVSFENTLDTVTVVGTKVMIDTSSTDVRTVITAKELARLPLTQSAQAIALLTPGANAGSGAYFGGLTSFGGAGVSENAYYVNGYFSGEPLSNLGQFELPYGAIAQQETYTGGYGAKYGRSAGGVISQVGKSGTNNFVYGGQFVFSPNGLRAKSPDTYYPKISLPSGYNYASASLPGTLYRRGGQDTRESVKVSAYAGGPIIQDKLFAFVSLEKSDVDTKTAPAVGTDYTTLGTTKDPKAYVKLNWNVTNDHLLEYTYLGEKYDYSGTRNAYAFATGVEGAPVAGVPTPEVRNTTYNILKYTGYLTDDLTLSATYGRSTFTDKQINPSIVPGLPALASTTLQNPAYNGGNPINNNQGGYQARDGRDYSNGLRADLEWKLNAAHTLAVGIDNITFKAENEGTAQVADRWIYGRLGSPGNISTTLGVGNPYNAANPNGYYVYKYLFSTATSMSLEQKAYYLEDRWNLSKNFLLTLGLRNDEFTNKNNIGQAYMNAKNQWAPRIGAAWDVNGDGSMKAFGNAGRYFLAMPNSVAVRGASASTFTRDYYTYTGIAANGAPTGLTPVPGIGGKPAPGPVSSNGEYGTPVDVEAFAPKDLKNMYQDEFILGFEKSLAKGWTAGVKVTHRALKSSIDDFCDGDALATAAGLTITGNDANTGKYIAQDKAGKGYYVGHCYMFNPGGSATYSFEAIGGGSRLLKKISSKELGFKEGVERKYSSIDLFLERAFDNVWSARVDYTYSKLKGNNEGQVKSEFGQADISKTQDWDAAALMEYANGYLFNDRRHQLKFRGSYQFAKEWMISGNARVLSGSPVSCLGYFNPGNIDEGSAAADPVGYGSSYHTCLGKVAKPGDVRTPWTYQIDMGLQYRPSMLQGKLAITANVFNLLNQQKVRQYDVTSESDPYTVRNAFMMPISYQAPRSAQISVSYDY